MLSLARCSMLHGKRFIGGRGSSHKPIRFLALCLLLITVVFEFIPSTSVQASGPTYVPRVNPSCSHVTYSSDGNPFPLCPGAYPQGGNCTWWSWEQWHLLGYDLSANWGNAADWIVSATRAGLSVGTTPRVGSIAVFPRGDGVWAADPAGHVAFVIDVNSSNENFTVTYQNYGDPTFMYIGRDYSVSVINQPQFQNGGLRFIYFPRPMSVQLFAKLPGVSAIDPVTAVNNANMALMQGSNMKNGQGTNPPSYTNDRIALGISPVSTDQELNADFTGQGTGNLLLYNRQQGKIDILRFDTNSLQVSEQRQSQFVSSDASPPQNQSAPHSQRVSLGDSTTPVGKWGSALDIHVGKFAGGSVDDILLYDRNTGSIQLISLNPDLSIKRHVLLPSIGAGWEIYVGQLDGERSAIFLYRRFAFVDPYGTGTGTATNTPGSFKISTTNTNN